MSRKTIITIIVAVVLVFGGTSIWRVSANKAQETESSKQVETIGKKVDALYFDGKKEMLAIDVTQAAIDEVESLLEKAEGLEMSQATTDKLATVTKEFTIAEDMFELQMQSNALLDGTGAIVENADVAAAEKMATALVTDKPEFVAVQHVKIDEARAQQDAITNATNAVNALFTSPNRVEVKVDVTRGEYDAAKALVDGLKQQTIKQMLTASLNQVDSKLVEGGTTKSAQEDTQNEAQANLSSNGSGENSSNDESSDSDNSGASQSQTDQSASDSDETDDAEVVNGGLWSGGTLVTK